MRGGRPQAAWLAGLAAAPLGPPGAKRGVTGGLTARLSAGLSDPPSGAEGAGLVNSLVANGGQLQPRAGQPGGWCRDPMRPFACDESSRLRG